jgi:hypothetical protein
VVRAAAPHGAAAGRPTHVRLVCVHARARAAAQARAVARAEPRGRAAALAAPPLVSWASPSWDRSILTEIYLCHACSYHEIEDGNARTGWRTSRRCAACRAPCAACTTSSRSTCTAPSARSPTRPSSPSCLASRGSCCSTRPPRRPTSRPSSRGCRRSPTSSCPTRDVRRRPTPPATPAVPVLGCVCLGVCVCVLAATTCRRDHRSAAVRAFSTGVVSRAPAPSHTGGLAGWLAGWLIRDP